MRTLRLLYPLMDFPVLGSITLGFHGVLSCWSSLSSGRMPLGFTVYYLAGLPWVQVECPWVHCVSLAGLPWVQVDSPWWVGIMRKRWSWSISRREREDDPSQSRERLALWQKKELEGLAWEKNPPLMESIVRNLVSLPMSGRMPRNMSALAPCWDGACGLPPRVQPWRGEGAPLIPKDVGVKGPMALKMVVENVRGEQIHIQTFIWLTFLAGDLLVDLLEPALAQEHWNRWEKYTFVW